MKKLLLGAFLLISLFNLANANLMNNFNDLINKYPSILNKYPWMKQNGWVDYSSICELNNELSNININCNKSYLLTENSFLPTWVGEITHFYYDKNKSEFYALDLKLLITWRTNDSKYSCGETIKLNAMSEGKNFTHRSLAMKKCD